MNCCYAALHALIGTAGLLFMVMMSLHQATSAVQCDVLGVQLRVLHKMALVGVSSPNEEASVSLIANKLVENLIAACLRVAG